MSKEDFFIQLKNELGKICLDQHLLSSEEFDVISKHAKNTEGNLYDLILKDGHATEDKLLKALEDKYGIPAVYTAKPIIPDFKNFPYQFCFKSGLIPIGDDGVTLEIGVAAPSCLNSIKNLNLLTGRKIVAKFIGASVLMYAIRSYDETTNSFIDRRNRNSDVSNISNPINPDQLAITVNQNKK